MQKYAFAGLMMAGLVSVAAAQPYGWLPGSTVDDTDKTGDHVHVVNLATNTTITPVGGWVCNGDSPGADPFVPGFSPDGKYVILVNGGDGNAGQPNGHLYVYDAAMLVKKFENGENPNFVDEVIDTEIIVSSNEDAIEPVGLTVSPAGDRVYLVDGKEQRLHVFDFAGGHLTKVNEINVGEKPSALWLNGDATKGYLTADNTNNPVVYAVDLDATPPAITSTLSIPYPAQSDPTYPYTSCGFPMPAGHSTTVVPFPSDPPVDDSELIIFSGYFGFLVDPNPLPVTAINDPVNIYKLDTSTDTLMNSGSPVATFNPTTNVIFPPFIQAFDNGNIDRALIGGSQVLYPNNTFDTLFTPNGTADKMVPAFGQMASDSNNFYIGAASAAAVNFLNPVLDTYNPSLTTSKIYKRDFTPNKANVNLTEVGTVQRSLNFLLGQTPTHMVTVASDTFVVNRIEGVNDPPGVRDSQVVLIDKSNDSLSVNQLDIIVGAYGQQPMPPVSPDEMLVLTEFTDIWASNNEQGSFGTPDQIGFIGFQHNIPNNWKTVSGDFDGDGLMDLATFTPLGQCWVTSNQGNNTFSAPVKSSEGWVVNEAAGFTVLAGDFNGDGTDDVAQLHSSGAIFFAHAGSGIIPSPSQAVSNSVIYNPGAGLWVGVADLNGDGKDDIVQIDGPGDSINVAFGTASSFDPLALFYDNTPGFTYDPDNNVSIVFGDFNGDGFDDVGYMTNEAQFAFSNGTTISSVANWGPQGFLVDPNLNNGWWIFAGDVDGDTISDLIQLNGFGEVFVALSNGVDGFKAHYKDTGNGFRHTPNGPWQVFLGNIK